MVRDVIQLILRWYLFVVKVLNAWDINNIFVLFKWTELMPDMNVYEMRKLSRQICVFWCSGAVMSIAKHQWVKQNIWMS